MSGGYSKQDVIENIRRTKSLNELHEIAYAKKGQVHGYAMKEAKREIIRRLTKRPIRKKPSSYLNRIEGLLR